MTECQLHTSRYIQTNNSGKFNLKFHSSFGEPGYSTGNAGKAFVIGICAGAVALVVSYGLRILAGGLFIPELGSQALFSVTPGSIESSAIADLGSLAKYTAFSASITVNLIIYGFVGILTGLFYFRSSNGWSFPILQIAGISYAIMFAISLTLSEITQLASQPLSIPMEALFLIPPHAAFGVVAYLFFRMSVQKSGEGSKELEKRSSDSDDANSLSGEPGIDKSTMSRRQFIRMIGIVAAGSIASIFIIQRISQLTSPNSEDISTPVQTKVPTSLANSTSASTIVNALYASEITPNDQFYRVDTDIVPPRIEAAMWNLMITGLVDKPLTFSYNDIRSMPSVDRVATLECVSNEVGGDLTSTALWKGVLLKDVLARAVIKPEAIYVVFRCYDGYDVGIPLDRALSGAFLAYEMNGATLPIEHGHPLRAIVPGLYGMMNAKWITSIELTDYVYTGFWQRRGWANNAPYKIHSSIVTPGNSLVRRFGLLNSSASFKIGEDVPIAGLAFAGDQGISKVEVSTDGGNTWQKVKLKTPLTDKNTWVLWSTEWTPRTEGKYHISVRAYDSNGSMQNMGFQPPFPEGSTGYHTVTVIVNGAGT